MRTIKCCSVVFGVCLTLRLLVINVSLSSPPRSTNSTAYNYCDITTSHGSAASCWYHLAVAALTAQDEARYMAQNRDFSLHRLHSMPISKSRSTRIFVSDAVGVRAMSNIQWWNSLYNRRNYLLKQNDHDCCTTVCKAYTCSQVLSSLIQRNAVRLQVSRFRLLWPKHSVDSDEMFPQSTMSVDKVGCVVQR